ncbi:MAG: phosphoribosylamine--glycine ligase [Phycisphaerales bacterium]|nr:phosphoribosylamine--glycine ligase [Phycisphaerales bacterium]
MPAKVNVLLVGGGGREHALAAAMKRSPRLGALYTTHPDNPGLAALCRPTDIPFDLKEMYRLEQFCGRAAIDLVVVGPEAPLAAGLADRLTSERTKVFGPTAEAARLESSKAWAKQLMRSASIPTAEARVFKDAESALTYVRTRDEALVVKASGLASGKGVYVCEGKQEAFDAVRAMFVERRFGDAGSEVVIEERLQGPEVSVFAIVDGRNMVILDACQDHKRLLEGDAGPNTGGMGAYCPTPLIDGPTMQAVWRQVLAPTVDALRREGFEYRGVLYAGLMLTPGGPKVLEFNVRFGDPECQCLVDRLPGDVVELLFAAASGRLEEVRLDDAPAAGSVCCIVLAAAGYPDAPQAGAVIEGVPEAEAMPGVRVYHAGTRRDGERRLVVAGGRVLNVVGSGATLEEARQRALAAADAIRFAGKQLRRDIGHQALSVKAGKRR